MAASYHVKIHNTGRAARVVHDGARPVRVGPGETLDTILSEETIKRIEAELHDRDPDEEPRLEVHKGEKAEGVDDPYALNPPHAQHAAEAEPSQHVASGAPHDQGAHKRGPPHK